MTAKLSGLWPPVATPFDADGNADTGRQVAHSRRLLEDGAHGLAILGTTSEANSLSLDDRRRVIDAHIDAGIEPAKLLPGTGACAIEDAVTLSRHAGRAGVAAVLLLPPFYYKNATDDGLYAFVAAMIDQLGADVPPIMLYHIPQMATFGWSPDLIGRLVAAYPEVIVGIKDSAGKAEDTLALIRDFPDLAVFPGAEVYLLSALRAGGAGCISATANINATGIRALIDHWQDAEADGRQADLLVVRKAFERHGMIPALKVALAERYGDPQWRAVRPPLLPLDDAARAGLLAEPAVARLLSTEPA
ncbi:dihydrodipicolinate synthase family protein [Bauldia sp.]|uniref:dihydrodipicolinate synthase family protein n=1 Tax=Bauldia sp. TaxID=2575872 RepID=UPI003BA96ACB